MSTSLLYHGFGARDYRCVKTKGAPGGVVLTMERKPQTYRCAACGSRKVGRQGVVVRSFRTVPIGSKRVTLETGIPRLACRECGRVRQAYLPVGRR